MNRQDLIATLIQTITGVAVLIGLAMVVYELKQTQDLARLQLSSDGYISGMDTQRSVLGESFAATRAKACFESENLTEAEIFEMLDYHNARITAADRMRIYAGVGQETTTWEQNYRSVMRMMLSTQVGRAQYAYFRRIGMVRPDEIAITNSLIREGIPSCESEIRRVVVEARKGLQLDDLLSNL